MNENEAARHADGFDFLAGLDLVVVARSPQARPVEEGRRTSSSSSQGGGPHQQHRRRRRVSQVGRSRTGLIVLWAGYRWRMLLAGEGIERWSQSFVLSPVWMVLQNLILEGNFAFMEY